MSGSRRVPSHSRCTLQQNANGRHKGLGWQDFDTGIVNSQTGRGGWMPQCSNPTCLPIHWGRRRKQPPGSSISASAWPHLSPLDEKSCLCGKVKQHGSRSAGLGQTLQADLTALRWNIYEVTSMESQRQKPASDPWAEPPAWTGPPAAP